MAPRAVASVIVSSGEMSPRAVARQLVRAILASTVRSTRQFSAAAAKETSAMPSEATVKRSSGGKSGVARHMPIIAVNTIRLLTRGLHRWLKAARRWLRLRVGAVAVCMEILLAGPGVFEQTVEIGAQALRAGVGRVGHDHQPLWINEQDGVGNFAEDAAPGGQHHEVGSSGWSVSTARLRRLMFL